MFKALHFSILSATDDDRRPEEDIVQHPLLSEYLLDPRGFENGLLNICHTCDSRLRGGRLPMYSLRNDLYRGSLPECFRDLTWVEEMACGIYRCTCHVTCLFHSGAEDQPRVSHGNTCAHDLNFVSTASVLPRVPADLKGMLSVVFLGPKQSNKDCLKPMYRIRKDKVWDFLQWLSENNPLYKKIRLSRAHLELYENDEIPGLDARLI
ncbi:uncharacterized protein EV420DRAFT_1261422, partial [Desarmillaria tabescens]